MKEGKLIVFNGSDRPLEYKNYALSPLKEGQILVRNKYTTICGSDIHTYCGLRQEACPTVLGHEIVGEIVEIDQAHPGVDDYGNKIAPGDIITWSIFSSDPQSIYAREGIPQKGTGLFKYGHAKITETDAFHGGLAEYCVLRPNTGILKIPSSIPLAVAAPLNCAIATVAASLRLAGDLKGKNVLVTGMGLLGIVAVAMSKEAGALWVGVTDISNERLMHAKGFGADNLLNTKNMPVGTLDKLREKFVKKGVDVVIDMSGSPDAMEMGLELLAIGGTAIWVGAVFNTRKISIDAEKLIRNLHTIKGIHNYNFEDFKYALDFLENNWQKYPFETVVEQEFSLADTQKAFEYAVANKPLRVGIRI